MAPLLSRNGERIKKSRERVASKNKDRLDELMEKAGYVIYETNSTRLLDPTPNRIAICPNRVTLNYHNLFSEQEYPIPIENVIGARVEHGFMHSTLIIETFGYTKPEPLKYLRPKDATLARRYILALVECKKNNIDLSEYNLRELRRKLNRIGTVRH